MAARKPRAAQNSTTPPWVILLIGIGLGLALAFLIQAVFLSEPNNQKQTKESEKKAKEAESEPGTSMPRFEFYSILPELEVVIPEQFTDSLREVLPNDKPEKDDGAETSAESTEAPVKTGETYFIQAGSFRKQEDAERMKIKLLLLGLDVETKAVTVEGAQYHRVRIGPLSDYRAFETARNRLKENNIQYIVLKSRAQ